MNRSHILLRLLTFLSFFQFSGIQNGYAALTTLSPVNMSQSVASVSVMLSLTGKNFQSALTPARRTMETVQSVTLGTLERLTHLAEAFRTGEGVRTPQISSAPGTRQWNSVASLSILCGRTVYIIRKDRETWLKRETWNDPNDFAVPMPLTFQFQAKDESVMRNQAVRHDRAHRSALHRILQFGGEEGPDQIALSSVSRIFIQSPGSFNRGIFCLGKTKPHIHF